MQVCKYVSQAYKSTHFTHKFMLINECMCVGVARVVKMFKSSWVCERVYMKNNIVCMYTYK